MADRRRSPAPMTLEQIAYAITQGNVTAEADQQDPRLLHLVIRPGNSSRTFGVQARLVSDVVEH